VVKLMTVPLIEAAAVLDFSPSGWATEPSDCATRILPRFTAAGLPATGSRAMGSLTPALVANTGRPARTRLVQSAARNLSAYRWKYIVPDGSKVPARLMRAGTHAL